MRHLPLHRSLLALAVATTLPALARAEEAPTADISSETARTVVALDQVVVTAQKRATNLQETPISVSVVDAEGLKDRSAISLGSLSDGSIPSLRVTPFATRSSALNIGIRGIGASGDANQPARDAGVGIYVDGVFMGRAQGLGSMLYDVERIEVLKGPQGTLFGRNTEGGAVSIVTKQPTGEFGGSVSAGVSNFGGYTTALHLDLPRVADLSFKVDAVQAKRDGTTDNPMRGERDFNAYDKRGARLSALWQPSEDFSLLYAFDRSYDATTPYHTQVLVPGAFLSPLQQAGASQDRRDSAILGGPQEDNIGRTSGHLLNLSWTLSDQLELKSISSYRELTQGQFDMGLVDAISAYGGAGTPFGRYSLAQVYQHQYSQEFQLIGNTDQLQFLGGAFFYHETAGDNAQTPNMLVWGPGGNSYTVNPATNPLDLSKVRVDRASKAWTDSLGVFGQATWTPEAMDRLHLTAGGRYTRDDKKGNLYTVNGAATQLAFNDRWSRFDPMVNIAYDLGGQAMVYVRYSTGFKAGGANSRSTNYTAFGPEEVTAYELGFKTQFWDDRARLNVALFDATIAHKQMDFSLPFDPNSGETRTTMVTTNALGDGRSRGAELEFNVMPVDNLTLALNYAYTKIDAQTAVDPFGAGVQVTVQPLLAPKNAGSLAIDYLVPFANFSALKFHVDGNWSDGFYTSEYDQMLTDRSFVVNARVALVDVPMNSTGTTMSFSLWARNLLDEQHLFYKLNSPALGQTGIFNDPRTFGLDVAINF
ncbi:TonB-dependent receptor [Stenotrophomonas maltophilia]|uniref:TonB-dependent receptor n=1 Tax=Stenotrophomonas maltophilia TaxID=40324 RepID=UPI0015ECA85E|nr:TonB-dependent receptor [Stenotrophomonas maltophilia]MBH1664373.1 TonB-dependent receptor [Stenotrophomonas maltophilia]HDS1219697.1 TonB-dependent receptor [Stenotrophomonas maltophilia]HDS1232642.1 TonB-dependent receptor [Stenotrophomonas maltophilia]